ncbi:MAG: gliding motility-associated C-terminal domain-containing protein [Paludibacteraceae bacterium]|nr:gliding motility-associated C-terminal domain-containing protein [Paludibacteraceae bacterium]
MMAVGKFKRLFALLLFVALSVLRAAATLTLSSDVDLACPGEAIVLSVSTTSEHNGHWFGYKYSYDKSKWEYVQSMTRLNHIATDMSTDASVTKVYYQVFDDDLNEGSNIIEVEKNTSAECSKTCHQTSTGDYFSGTDFNPESGITSTKPTIPSEIVDFFGENDIEFSCNECGDYSISTNLSSLYGTMSPSLDDKSGNPNYYYIYNINPSNNKPFTYKFKCSTYVGKNYRYTMRFYLMKTNPDCGGSASIKLETGHGNQTTDRCAIDIIDDATGEVMDSMYITETFGLINLGLGDSKYANKLLRVEVNYYGHFPDDKYDRRTGQYNGLPYFTLNPMFQQFDGCFRTAIDYISAEIESVCMSKGAYCVGDYALVNAAGFPHRANYKWEVKENGVWTPLVISHITQAGPEFTRVAIPVTAVGKKEYRVTDTNRENEICTDLSYWDNERNQMVNERDCRTVSVEFTVTGKDCAPVAIDSVKGPDILCAPSSAEGDTMTVHPIDVNPNVSYHWTLVDPSGNTITDKTIVYQEESNVRGTQIILRLPATVEEGEYKLTVSMSKTENGYTSPVGSAYTKKITVYRTPKAHFTVDGFINDGNDAICPSDNHQEIYAEDNSVLNPKHEYIYTWFHANSVTANGDKALISWSDEDHDALCDGTLSKYKVGESVEIKGVGCKASWDTLLSVTRPLDPVIDCEKLGKSPIEIKLGAKQSTATITLPVPEISGSCDRFPTVTITGVGEDAKGKDLGFTIEANLDDLKNNKVADMIRKVTATAGVTGTNGLTVTYSVVDGCGKTSNVCSIKYIVRDVTGPDIPCSDIKSYETRLSYYNVNEEDGADTCKAYPGEGSRPELLPVIKPTKLKDQNGVDGTIEGVFIGRLDNQATEPIMSESLFSKSTIKLNDPVPAGHTYILWKYADAVGNAVYCMQKITVIDDKKPVVNCPDEKIKDVSVQQGSYDCGLSLDSLLAKLPAVSIPTAVDVCPTETAINTSVIYYRQQPSKTWILISDKDELIFKLGNKYDVAWRFYKQGTGSTVDKTVYAECIRSFNIVDSVAPIVDCSVLTDTAVTVNINAQGDNQDYASATDTRPFSYITYTLKGFFKDIPYATDACEGEIRPVVSVVTPDGKETVVGKVTDTKTAIRNALNKFHFPVGLSTIVYTYADSKGNKSFCNQNIIVYKGIAMNCTSELTLYADENCKGNYDIKPATVETALVSYVRQYVYKVYNAYNMGPGGFGPGGFGPAGPAGDFKIDPVKRDDNLYGPAGPWGPMVQEYGFNGLPVLTDSMKGDLATRLVNVYPIKVVKITNVDENGNKTANSVETKVDNMSKKTEFDFKVVQHQNQDMWGNVLARKTQVYKKIMLQDKTFDKDFTKDFKTFDKGTHKLIWYYENGQGDKDSCVVIVSVVDTTSPKVICGKWGKDIVKASDPVTCTADVVLEKPTAEQLGAEDNCTTLDDIKVDFERVFKGVVSHSLTDPYQQGTTVVTWIISDESNNKAYCVQNITVNDSTGPKVDCDELLVNPIKVLADKNCQANKEAMVEAGFYIPVLDESAELCSPTKEPIRGVGYRENTAGEKDGLDIMNDPYPLGTTIVVWTFTDSLGNSTVCRQVVQVEDKQGPDVNCDEFEKNPINFYLAPTECNAPKDSIMARLGEHTAKDNCDPEPIKGIPYMATEDGRVAIPAAFNKDTTYTVVWVFTDAAGNETTCEQKFAVIDTTVPNNNICPDPVKNIDAKVKCTLTFEDLDLPELTINDLCDGLLVGKLTGEVQQPGGTIVYPATDEEFKALQYYAGTENNFTWTFTDHAGLTSTCEMKVIINDSIPPVINNCETGNDATYEMSEGVCYAKWEDISKLIVIPLAYDECEELIDGNGSSPLDPFEIRRYHNDTLVTISRDGDEAWKADPFPRGTTRFVWMFKDRAGNIDSCVKTINIILRTNPSFICDSINPNPMRPIAEKGTCSIFFDDLEFGKYYGYHACTGDSLEAKLLLGPMPDALPVPHNLEFLVGDTVTVFWVVTDEFRNFSFCPQVVIPSHSNPIDFDCNTLKPIEALALEGECYIPANQIELPNPYAVDSCAKANGAQPENIYGVPTRSDSLPLTDNYPTGVTTISWMFVSPFNILDTLVCEQPVFVKGNKHFDLDCDVILPTIHDTVPGCEPANDIVLTAPEVPDPCVADTVITGVPFARSDEAEISAPFPLGTTYVTWTFTDATGNITDTCRQRVIVLTEKELEKPCDTAPMKTINVLAPEDACTVPSSDVKLETPFALHPCTQDTVWGVLSRPGIADLGAPYNIGLNRLIWTFTDTTGTLVKPIDTCQQFVKVGDVDVEPVDCKNMPNINKVLEAGNCTIDFSDFELNIPAVIDRCPNGDPNAEPVEILPTISRTSKPGWTGHRPSEIGSFGVGRDTIYWDYVIAGNEYRCEQIISVKDSVEPEFDCGKLKPVQAEAEEDECEVAQDVVLALLQPYPEAVETCTNKSIVGVPTLLDGSALPETFKVGDTVVIKWTFIDTLVNTKAKTCQQQVTVIGNNEPIFDCSTLDTLNFIAHDACSIVLDKDSIPTPVAKDFCTLADVPGVASREDGDAYGEYNTGFTTITWTFNSPYSKKPKTCPQTIWVRTDKEIDAKCGEQNYPTINVSVEDGICEVPATDITAKLREHSAVNPCHSSWTIKGVATRSDGKDLNENYPVGVTIITWTFTDTTKTLLNPVSTCEQQVVVGDNNEPPVDCETAFPDVKLYLTDDNCDYDFSAITVNLTEMPVNACNGDVAVLDTVRESGKPMSAAFGVGSDVIVWTFTFPSNNQKVVCRQKVDVFDTIAPKFNCNELIPVITVPFTTAGVQSVTYDEVVAKGFFVPEVEDLCCTPTVTVTRSDGKDYKDDYPFGETTVIFTISDDHDNSKVCSQIIKVTDMVPPELECPHFGGSYSCLQDIPQVLDYEQFIAAGGSIDDPSRADISRFEAEDEITGDVCEATVWRTYYVYSIRDDRVACKNGPDVFTVKDDMAPTYKIGDTDFTGIDIDVTCANAEYEVPTVLADDNCDPDPTITMSMESTQGDDPSKCDYYNYDIIYTWKAVDRCGNAAAPVKFTVHVVDTLKPVIHKPKDWDLKTYPSFLKHCLFGVPDITALLPRDSIELSCGGNEFLKIWQTPEAGSVITQTTEVALHIQDVCGNESVIYKTVYVQSRDQIVKVYVTPTTVCGDDESLKNPRSAENSLANDRIAYSEGRIRIQDFDGSWILSNTNVLWDYFRGGVEEKDVIYSNNPITYGDKFVDALTNDAAGDAAYAKYNLLLRRTQSDVYYYVATDTVSGCSDTASVYINVIERPRIALNSGIWDLCEGDSLNLNGDFSERFSACIDPMGDVVIATGWMVNDSVYKPNTPIDYEDGAKHTAVFYATGELCGTSTSLNTLYTNCGEGAPTNHADSLAVFGSEENMKLADADKLYTRDSVDIVVATHYDAAQVLLTTKPNNKPRVWEGEMAELQATMPYTNTMVYRWMKVVGEFDAEQGAVYNRYGDIVSGGSNENDDVELENVWAADDKHHTNYLNRLNVLPEDSTYYYVVVGNGVCPSVSSNLVNIDVLHQLPTAITPYDKDGMNDDFMRGHSVIIFNRYGQMIYEGNDGWDGTYRGLLADPGVYYYEVQMRTGTRKGALEVVKIE